MSGAAAWRCRIRPRAALRLGTAGAARARRGDAGMNAAALRGRLEVWWARRASLEFEIRLGSRQLTEHSPNGRTRPPAFEKADEPNGRI